MDVHVVTAIFLVALAADLGLQTWLALRHAAYIRANAAKVPEPFAADITLEAHEKAARYTVAKVRLHIASMIYSAVILLGWTLGGGLDALDTVARAYIAPDIWRGIAVIFATLFVSTILDLPFTLYSTFVIEQRFGFNRTTAATFVADMIKGGVIALVIGVPLLYAILWTVGAAGSSWWLWAWGIWIAASLIQTWAYPRIIAPLFNKFSPLTDMSLKERVERLAAAIGFHVRDIFVMDGSRRSAHGNAYMTGFGRNKRIVFFDTLIAALQPPEVEAVLAHELGHYRLRHIQKMLATSILVSFAGWAILGWLAGSPWFFHGLGVSEPSTYMALLLFVLVGPVFTVVLRPLFSMVSRRFEFQADDFAAKYSDSRALIAALKTLYRDNANTLTPDPLYSAFYHSHPAPLERIRHLLEISPSAAAPAPAPAHTS